MNWKQEAIDYLHRYNLMAQALENIPQEIRRLRLDSVSTPSARASRIRVKKTPAMGEDRLLNNMVKRGELENAYEQAKIWVRVTQKALSVLPEDERQILTRMYIDGKRGATDELCRELGVEQSSVYRRRDVAIHHFTIALYGTA